MLCKEYIPLLSNQGLVVTVYPVKDDKPNFTPRISGIVHADEGNMNYAMHIIKSLDGDPECTIRNTYAYSCPKNGEGRFIHTYKGAGDPLPSYEGEPKRVIIPDLSLDDFTKLVWDNLNKDNKVSLFTRYIDIETGKFESRIVNKNK